MRILVKTLYGIVWSICFIIASALAGALVTAGLEALFAVFDFIGPSFTYIFSRVVAIAIMVLGPLSGFYIGYTRALKKDPHNIDNKRLVKKLVFPFMVLCITGFVVYILVLNMRAYNKYGFYVHASDESVFVSKIDPHDPRIVNHGRIKKEKIFELDREVDNGDGRRQGKVRWYECYGIDCDEAWETRLIDR